MSKVFLYRIKDSEDRDSLAYIEENPLRFECGHYFGGVNLHGACYCGHTWNAYGEIETILTEAEYNALRKFDQDIGKLGYGIERGDSRYQEGVELCRKIQPVYDRLCSEDAKEFFQNIVAEEKEIVMDEHDLTEDEVEEAFNAYPLDYQDRSIIGCVFEDTEELGREEAYELGYVGTDTNNVVEKYFDFEKFGEDLLNEENYYQLDSGRIVTFEM
jgi:hypothetical protein